MFDENHRVMLEDKLIAAFGATWRQRSDVLKEAEKFLKIVLECCQVENLVS